MKEFHDIVFKEIDGFALRLDLYLPDQMEEKPPLILWIHGGGWCEGKRGNPMLDAQVKRRSRPRSWTARMHWPI